jgi:hypothetical protein
MALEIGPSTAARSFLCHHDRVITRWYMCETMPSLIAIDVLLFL